jgi:nucleotide-binding universal stress UspA family protein
MQVKFPPAPAPTVDGERSIAMFKHILIPTDGSQTADKAVKAGLKFAKFSGARVTLFTAVPEYEMPSTGEIAVGRILPVQEYERRAMREAQHVLKRVARRAKAAGVPAATDAAVSDRPWQAIVRAAKKHRCDLIFIASHGRKGLSALVQGSETDKVLKHSRVPTLVVR